MGLVLILHSQEYCLQQPLLLLQYPFSLVYQIISDCPSDGVNQGLLLDRDGDCYAFHPRPRPPPLPHPPILWHLNNQIKVSFVSQSIGVMY